ncbi:MAG TPA: RdgB/HAM1 family non-canonical purine NTP pyrophosphatase [Gammaproteobacteria bacterium]
MTVRWVVATGNRGKLAEIRTLLRDADVALVSQDELGIEPAAETAPSFVENALLKARHACERSGLPAIADDSGLCVDALGGAPGVRSARWAGPDADDRANVARLLEALEGVPEGRRGARFHCVVVALASPEDPAPLIATGTWAGRIATAPSGSGGFGYDPVFFDPLRGCTAAELPPERKNEISHRGIALRRLARLLEGGPGAE